MRDEGEMVICWGTEGVECSGAAADSPRKPSRIILILLFIHSSALVTNYIL